MTINIVAKITFKTKTTLLGDTQYDCAYLTLRESAAGRRYVFFTATGKHDLSKGKFDDLYSLCMTRPATPEKHLDRDTHKIRPGMTESEFISAYLR